MGFVIGCVMLAVPFTIGIAIMARDLGVSLTLMMWSGGILTVAWIMAAMFLIAGGK